MRSKIIAVTTAIVVFAAATGVAVASGAISLSTNGQLGPLRLDHSTASDVKHFLGSPVDTKTGSFDVNLPKFQELQYGCKDGKICADFYINRQTGKLVGLSTTSSSFVGPFGVKVGMNTAQANGLAHRKAMVGCEPGFYFGSSYGTHRTPALLIVGDDGRANPGGRVLHGGHVDFIEFESTRHPVGVTFC